MAILLGAALVAWVVVVVRMYGMVPGFSHQDLAAGAAIVAAGFYQLTPLKRSCLARCRAPLGFVVHRWRGGALGPLALGLEHGLICVGCCAGLMAILFALGLMSLFWMTAVTALVCAEKLLAHGERLSIAFAFALIVLGFSVALLPESMPA